MKIGFTGLLALLFIGLKLAGQINWSWLWVLSPLWIPLSLFLFIVLLQVLCLLLMGKEQRAIVRLEKKLKAYGKRKH